MIRTPAWLCVSLAIALLAGCSTAPKKTSLEINAENATVIGEIDNDPDLRVLSISCLEDLKALPDAIGRLTDLRELKIDNGNGCSMNPVLPENIGRLRSLEKLVLFGAQDPRDGVQPHERHPFPASISRLKNLTYLDLGRNGLDQIPSFVQELPKLTDLGFAFNQLKEVPPSLSTLKELTRLWLDGNDLTDLPDFLNTLPKLKRISLGDNCKITGDEARTKELQRRFPNIELVFEGEYDCPEK